ncbi:MAG: uracil-DNA glycosylase [Micavibrio sp.]
MADLSANPYLAALQWHIAAGADELWLDSPNDRTKAASSMLQSAALPAAAEGSAQGGRMMAQAPAGQASAAPPSGSVFAAAQGVPFQDLPGTAQSKAEAIRLAKSCKTLEELQAAIQSFDGLAIKKTATQIVFADGNPAARVMLVGEAPGGDEDRMGKPFVGISGQLLDRIFAAIGLARTAERAEEAVYISNILNWRPPGNRTPSPAEVDISLPFIERHIALVRPQILILCGGVAAKGLLGSGESISRLRGKFHAYTPVTPEIGEGLEALPPSIPAIATYHPAYLLRTPSQKKAVWADMLDVRAKLSEKAG